MYLLGIDIGTSGTKTALFDEAGTVIARDTQEYPLYRPAPGWAEQDAEDWWRAAHTSIRNVIDKSGVTEIGGVGLSGQMHGLVMLDKNDKPLRRAIIWCDQRTLKECEEITAAVGERRLLDITANPALTGFTASKIKWVQNHEPELYEKAVKLLLPKDYIRYKLTGEFASEVSDASGTQLMDVAQRTWSGEVLEKLHIDKSLLGKMHESQEITGGISEAAAKLTGLRAGTPVVGGAGDQAAAAVGSGIVKSGIVSSVIGTSGVIFASTGEMKLDKAGRIHTFCHAVPNLWHVMGVTQSAGLSLKWFRENFCREEAARAESTGADPYTLMDEIAAEIAPCCEGVIYLPYLTGERTPHLDPFAKGVFFGLTSRHTKAHLLRAVMEGVAFSLRDCLEVVKETGAEASEVRASGGGGKSGLWRQMQADVFGAEVKAVSASEAGALGVAILAGVGAGVFRDVPQACEAVVSVSEAHTPNFGVYEGNYAKYKQLYTALKDIFKEE